jgi:hypothetical protein
MIFGCLCLNYDVFLSEKAKARQKLCVVRGSKHDGGETQSSHDMTTYTVQQNGTNGEIFVAVCNPSGNHFNVTPFKLKFM